VTSVVIVDDQALVRAGLRLILDQDAGIDVLGEAANGKEALDLVAGMQPDVALMDIRMPVLDGIEATRRIAAARRGTHVLMLTTFGEDEQVVAALRAGASGFLLKDVDPPDLVHAIRVVARGDALLAPDIVRRLMERFVTAPTRHAAMLTSLTQRELQILRLIARGLSNEEIGTQLFISTATVKTHVTKILGKLNLRDRTQAVVLAYESGLLVPGRD
jgi:DNA-binding NarL/FixJ family response regulator